MSDFTLYSMPSSGNSYKVRLLLAFLGIPYTHVGMEYLTPELDRAHSEGLLPLSRLPVLQFADGTRMPESNAILTYLASGTAWLSEDPLTRAQTLAWMFWEQNQHEGTIAVRAALLTYEHRKSLATPERLAELLNAGHEKLGQMEAHLKENDWLIGSAPTIADIALYAYTHSAEEKGGFEMDRFPAINAWLSRFAALPGYVSLTDIPA